MAQARRSDSVITPLDERRRRQALLTLGILSGSLLAVLGLVVLYLWLSWQRVYWADQVTRSRAELSSLQIERDSLKAEVAEAFSLKRLARWARQQGMVDPELNCWPPQP